MTVMTTVYNELLDGRTKILVELELHTRESTGIGMIRSRDISAP